MKRHTLILYLSPLILFIASCKHSLILLSGLKQPDLESVRSVSDYLGKKGITGFDTLYVCRDSASLSGLMATIKAFPATLLFDRYGYVVHPSDTAYCPGKAEGLIRHLSPASSGKQTSRLSLHGIRRWTLPIAWNQATMQDPDFSLFVFWARYCGSLNNGAFRVMKAASENHEIRVNIYLVNVDFLDGWGLTSGPQVRYQ